MKGQSQKRYCLKLSQLNISLTWSAAKRSAKNVITESADTPASSSFSFCVAMLTQAHVTVEGGKTENLHSDN